MSRQTVSEALDRVLSMALRPRSITVDHGTEFQSRALEDWVYGPRRPARFHSPGGTRRNAFIEAFNGRLRDECLNVHQFAPLADTKANGDTVEFGPRAPPILSTTIPARILSRIEQQESSIEGETGNRAPPAPRET